MVPYRDNGHLTQSQKHYNIVHSSARSTIERAFGRLKGKFRRLKGLDVTRTDFAPIIIETACALHNLILKYDSLDDDDDDNDDNDDDGTDGEAFGRDDPASNVCSTFSQTNSATKDAARIKRDNIMTQL